MSKIPTNSSFKFKLSLPDKLDYLKKNLHHHPQEKQNCKGQMTRFTNYCLKSMINKHNSQRQFYHLQLINHILDVQQQRQIQLQPQIRIKAIDYKFNDQYQYLGKYFKANQVTIQMIDLISYYKYYLQNPVVTCKEHFRAFFLYHQKKKQQNYKLFKKMIDSQYVPSSSGISIDKEIDKDIIPKDNQFHCTKKLSNILGQISDFNISSQEKDQSTCFIRLRDRLVNKFGDSKHEDMKQIDKKFHFANKYVQLKDLQKLVWAKKRTNKNVQIKIQKKCRTLQSTNSTTNQNIFYYQALKQQNNRKKDNKNYLTQKRKLQQKQRFKQRKIEKLKTLYNQSVAKDYFQSLQNKINKVKQIINQDLRTFQKSKTKIYRKSCQDVQRLKFCTFFNQQSLNNRKIDKNDTRNLNYIQKVSRCSDVKARVRVNRNKLKTKINSCQTVNKIGKNQNVDHYVQCYRTSINSIRKQLNSIHNQQILRHQNIKKIKQQQKQARRCPSGFINKRQRQIKGIYHQKTSSQLNNKKLLRNKNSIEKNQKNRNKNYVQIY